MSWTSLCLWRFRILLIIMKILRSNKLKSYFTIKVAATVTTAQIKIFVTWWCKLAEKFNKFNGALRNVKVNYQSKARNINQEINANYPGWTVVLRMKVLKLFLKIYFQKFVRKNLLFILAIYTIRQLIL